MVQSRGSSEDLLPVDAGAESRRAVPPPNPVSVRAIAIACGLMPLLALWVVQSELIWYSGHSTAISLFFHVTFVIFLLALANLVIEKHRPRAALAPAELMTIYVMLSVAGTFCSHDLLQVMIPMLGFPHYYANPQNNWAALFLEDYIPDWAVVSDPRTNADALHHLAVGNGTLYRLSILKAWIRPLSFWFVFLMALIGALTCINILFRKHWTEQERLSFPVIQIPMMIATELPRLLKNRLFWIAFALSGGIDIVNGLNHFRPNLPRIPIVHAFTFRDYLVERPWNAIANTEINLYPFVIGLTFFMPTDLAFSCWFFYLFFKLQIVLTAAVGIHDLPGFPFPNEQAAGGYLALGLLAIWVSRRHLAGAFRTAFGRPGGVDDSDEPLRYRTTVILGSVCTALLLVQGCMLASKGLSSAQAFRETLVPMIIFFLVFFLYSIAIARMRAELGPPAHDLHGMGPEVLIHNAVGTKALGHHNLAGFAMFFWFNRAYRAHYSAHNMEGFKLAQMNRILARSMLKAIMIAVVVGALAAIWALLHALYVHGYSGRPAGDAFAQEAWTRRMVPFLVFPQRPRVAATIATAFGLLFSLLLGALRMRFTWWLWHPVGYATATSWSMGKLWACIFVGWLAKALITRYGGARMYRKALPFFVGLVLGEFTVGSLWMIYGSIAGTTVYHFWG